MSLLALTVAVTMSSPSLMPIELRCENLVDPLAIERRAPILEWKPQAHRPATPNLRQTAYQILAATDPKLLQEGRADLWDSKKVNSKETYGIEYGGKPLGSSQTAWWTVRIWDQSGVASDWSKAARFTMGLLNASDWKSKWIAIDAPETLTGAGAELVGASWIWGSLDEQGKVPKVTRSFTKSFSANPTELESAWMSLTVDDKFLLHVNGKEVGRSDDQNDSWRRPLRLDLKPFLNAGENQIRIEATNDGATAAGVLGRLVLRSSGGSETQIVTDASWSQEGGAPVVVVAPFGGGPWGRLGLKALRGATYYRKSFSVKPKLKRATAYVTALGLVDLHLNGKRVSEDLFTPGWTDYDKRVHYLAFDVTKSMKRGENAVGAVLGDGWYSGFLGYSGTRSHYGDRPRVRVQLNLEYADGSAEIVGTNSEWEAFLGPTVEQDFLMGEVFDARIADAKWSTVGYKVANPQRPYEVAEVKAKLEAFPTEPVREYAALKAKTVKEIRPGVFLLDFGQNLAGFLRIKVRGKAGQRIVMRHGEWLNPDGTLYTANLRGARATDTYICSGKGEETWEPRFTFHGFQYAEISGLDKAPDPDDFVAVAISSATPEVGQIETSDGMLNTLAKNAWWTQKMNFIDVPTDCPQRDERLGWTGDAQAYIRTANLYSDNQSFFRKWLVSLDDGQRADGQYPMVAPLKVAENDGGPAWADAGVICPWTTYEMYGDKRLLAEHYPQMKKFVEFCRKRSTPDLLPPEKFHCFGDWLSINADTPHDVIYTAYFSGSARLLAKSAEVLGKAEEARQYHKLADDVAAAFRKAYVSPAGVVKGDTQCGYVLALAFDLVDGELAKQAGTRLVADIEKRGWHLSTGFVGTRDIMHVLTKIGRNDVAFRLLHQTTFPSWKFEIVNGATTVWERWDGWTPEKGFQDPGMNSAAHYAYGAVMGWVFENIGGISQLAPGYEKIKIAPEIDPNLSFAKTTYNSVRGPIRTHWRVSGGKLSLEVELPPNTTAEIHVPFRAGSLLKDNTGVTPREVNGKKVFDVGSGRYRLEADLGT